MKIVWGLSSIPEFDELDKLSAKDAWIHMYQQVRSHGDCKLAPIVCAGVCVLVMTAVVLLMALFPFIPDLVRFTMLIVSSGVGGYLGGVVAMSLNYKAGRRYLTSNPPE